MAQPELVDDRAKPEELDEEQEALRKGDRRPFFLKHPHAKRYIIAIAAVLVVGAVLWWMYARVRESTDDAQIEGNVTPVAARVAGTVQKVLVNDNQQVKAGDILVQLDPADYLVAVQKAEADLAEAQANAGAAVTGVPVSSMTYTSDLAVAKANLAAAQKEVDTANARLAEAKANYTKVAADLKRFTTLVAKDEVSRQQYDAAVANEQTAAAAVQAAEAAVAAAQSHVVQAQAQVNAAGTAPQQIAITRSKAGSAEALVKAREAALAQAKLNLEYCTVRAAVDGVVTKKSVQPGQIVQPGQPLMALSPLQDVWVVANFKENQLQNMKVGQKATVHVDAYDKDFDAHVDSIGGTTAARTSLLPPENATGNYVKVVQRVPVKIVFDKGQDPQHPLLPGMSVVATVRTDSK